MVVLSRLWWNPRSWTTIACLTVTKTHNDGTHHAESSATWPTTPCINNRVEVPLRMLGRFLHNFLRRMNNAIVTRFRKCSHDLNVESKIFWRTSVASLSKCMQNKSICQCFQSREAEDDPHIWTIHTHGSITLTRCGCLCFYDQLNVFHGSYL